MLKLLLPVVALLAVGGAAAGVAVYLANGGETSDEVAPSSLTQVTPTPTPAPTETPTPTPAPDGWTTYQDAELGFSFPYPQGSALLDVSAPSAKEGRGSRLLTLRDAADLMQLSITIIPNDQDLPLRDWVEENYPCALDAPSGASPIPFESISIAGEAGLMCPYNTLGRPNPVIYFEHAGNVFSVTANTYGAPPGITEADFQRIIDGFSFGP